MNSNALKFELLLAALLFCFGVAVLPLAIYWVGVFVVGPYEGKTGVMSLLEAIWQGLGQGQIVAWLLVVSPYVVVQLVRLARVLWRS
ncbi:MAG TPA: hypothetical protein VFV10_01125 [Gammaproteobacteria bacterium]|nr:hypothetical protein [Gammaproteobacteria bacterium]